MAYLKQYNESILGHLIPCQAANGGFYKWIKICYEWVGIELYVFGLHDCRVRFKKGLITFCLLKYFKSKKNGAKS